MPHQHRHTRKAKKPKRTRPLSPVNDEALEEHRELAMLRIAGAARPGSHKDKLLAKRMEKLDEIRKRNERTN